MWMNK